MPGTGSLAGETRWPLGKVPRAVCPADFLL
jgi:hypothetical protein